MYHFVTFIWNPLDPNARAAATQFARRLAEPTAEWQVLSASDGMMVYARTPPIRALKPYILPRSTGVILGRIFPTRAREFTSTSESTIDEAEGTNIIHTMGKSLVRDYWGSYVAFLSDAERKRHYVIRDCSGKLPCYRTRQESVEIIFSDVADLAPLGLRPFRINSRYVAAFIYSDDLQVRESGLSGITEILAGECLEIGREGSHQFSIWDPRQVYQARSLDDYEAAVIELKDTTQRCIEAWASVYDTILHRLSGGLDSAIVLGCLSKAQGSASVTCVNFYGENTGEDERRFARVAATEQDVRLIEKALQTESPVFGPRLLDLPKSPKPSIGPLFVALHMDDANRIATQLGADAVWTGQGGDHLFFQSTSHVGAADYMQKHGIGVGLWAAVVDAAHLSSKPYLTVLRDAWKLARSQTSWRPSFGHSTQGYFVNSEALPRSAAEYVAHPWTVGIERLPKGKQLQIHLLADVLNRERPLPRFESAYEHHPLLSQPLLELCLQIPVYLLTRGGRQRALARHAFRDRVPAEILQREDKGGVAFTVTDGFRRSLPFIREILLNGNLVRDQIIRQDSLEPFIVNGESLQEGQLYPLLACLAAELWTRSWEDTAMRIAA